MSKKIVIFDTGIGSGNVGDDIIMESCLEHLYAAIPNSGTMLRVGTHVVNFNLPQMLLNGPKVKWFNEADLKFILGTNLLSNNMKSGLRMQQWQLFASNKKLYRGAILMGVGATNMKETRFSAHSARLYKSILSERYIHSVRDTNSHDLLESIGIRSLVTGCPTLWKMDKAFCEGVPEKKAEMVITAVSGQKKYHSPKKDAAMLKILKENYRKCFVWLQTGDDEAYFDSLPGHEGIEKIYTLYRYDKMLNERKYDYVGTRLHGGVYALRHQARTIVVSIDGRAEGFHEMHELPVIPRAEVPKELEKRINASFKTRIRNDEKAIQSFLGQF